MIHASQFKPHVERCKESTIQEVFFFLFFFFNASILLKIDIVIISLIVIFCILVTWVTPLINSFPHVAFAHSTCSVLPYSRKAQDSVH